MASGQAQPGPRLSCCTLGLSLCSQRIHALPVPATAACWRASARPTASTNRGAPRGFCLGLALGQHHGKWPVLQPRAWGHKRTHGPPLVPLLYAGQTYSTAHFSPRAEEELTPCQQDKLAYSASEPPVYTARAGRSPGPGLAASHAAVPPG